MGGNGVPLVGMVLLVSGCASMGPLRAELHDASTAVRAAIDVGAEEVFEAGPALGRARSELSEARKRASLGDTSGAASAAARARADALVAQAIAIEWSLRHAVLRSEEVASVLSHALDEAPKPPSAAGAGGASR